MVRFQILSEHNSPEPMQGGGEKITGGPLYDLGRVKSIVQGGTGLNLWTKDCIKNVQDLGWEHANVIALVNLLTRRDYIDSEWCDNGKGALAACDAYRVKVRELNPNTGKEMDTTLFLKFAINKLGTMLLTVSCHV